jgi:hypothetical protein
VTADDGYASAILTRGWSRRKFIAATAVTAGAAALSLGAQCDPALIRKLQQGKNPQPPHHRVWVWQFSSDSEPAQIAANLGANDLGVLVKTHDGLDWMSRYDRSSNAVNGPAQVEKLARLFEDRGVPFHAWSVIKGIDPLREAQMVADVLSAGARSVVLDLEAGAGFWAGTQASAAEFGDHLRRLTPFGRVDISIDPRPWRINLVPMAEFVAMSDGIWPQLYWDTFNSSGNLDGYRNTGFPPGANGITPEFLLDTTNVVLAQYDREIIPIGQGAAIDLNTWARFTRRAWELGWGSVSVWRYGVTRYETLSYLGENPAGIAPKPPKPVGSATRTPSRTPTSTRTPKPTRTPTSTRTRTPTPTRTFTPTPTSPPTLTPLPSGTAGPV